MSYETVITLLLLLLALLLGAFCGCLWRRWTRPSSVETETGSSDTVETGSSDTAESTTASPPEVVTSKHASVVIRPVEIAPKPDLAVSEAKPLSDAKDSTPDKPETEQSKPVQARGLASAIGGKADDLKIISGVGPKLEKTLNELGIFHFEQIASWTTKDVREVDDLLTFKGRIERDKWIDQAKKLMDK